MSFFARRNPEAAALAVQVSALTTELAALTARLAVQAPAPVLTIDGKSGHHVLKRSIYDTSMSGLGYYGSRTEWRYVTDKGALTSLANDAQHFDTAALAMQRATELTGKKFKMAEGEQDTGSWRTGYIHAVWTEDR